jgi:hypothetical protein
MLSVIKKLGGRKVVIGVLLLAVGIAVDYTFQLSQNLLYLMIAVSTGFFLGNVGEHAAEAGKKRASKIPTNNQPPSVGMAEVEETVKHFNNQQVEMYAEIQDVKITCQNTQEVLSKLIDKLGQAINK